MCEGGGSARPRDIYDRVASHFPSMTEEERDLMVQHGIGVQSKPLMIPQLEEEIFAATVDEESEASWRA